jgi:GAF domain-containing protein
MKSARFTRVARAASAATAAIAAAGCFAYRSAEPSSLRPGQVVRVALTPAGADDVTNQVGPRVTALDGRVIGLLQLFSFGAARPFSAVDEAVVVQLAQMASATFERMDLYRR